MLIVLLASVLYFTGGSLWRRAAALILAAALVGTLAFAGHAAAGEGPEGIVHLTADVLHLCTAASWIGALVPLALLLGIAASQPDGVSLTIARERRFAFRP